MTFNRRLYELGFATYEAYLCSPHWDNVRRRYEASKLPKECAVCGYEHYQLHHTTYERLGMESLSDFTPLCQCHHEAVHVLLKDSNKPLSSTAWAVNELKKMEPKIPGKASVHPIRKCFICGSPAKKGKALCRICLNRNRSGKPPVQVNEPIKKEVKVTARPNCPCGNPMKKDAVLCALCQRGGKPKEKKGAKRKEEKVKKQKVKLPVHGVDYGVPLKKKKSNQPKPKPVVDLTERAGVAALALRDFQRSLRR